MNGAKPEFPERLRPRVSDDPEILARYARDTVYSGHPQAVCRTADVKTIAEILAHCSAHGIPVTPCGSQTSMTGASVADFGLALPLGGLDKIIDVGRDPTTGEGFAVTEPGVILGDLKRAVAAQGFLYPPDPTSYEEAQIGATVSTNATGEDTFRYGPTRWYVEELDVLDARGESRKLKRSKPFPHDGPKKNLAGYFLGGEEIDEIIGSEGTLAVITKIRLALVSAVRDCFLLLLPFSRFETCLDAVVRIASGPLKPRALELIGPGAGAYFRSCPSCPEELRREEIFLYVKDDFSDAAERDLKMGAWFKFLEKIYAGTGETQSFECVHVALTPAQREAIRLCRHHIPLKVNEEYFPLAEQGGGKVGTDWWVPLHHLQDMMLSVHEEALNLGLKFLVFAHIGDGHPHWNFLTRTPEERKTAHDFVLRQCRRAALLGGGVAGEHGLGKIKRDLLKLQHAPKALKKMAALKEKWDPKWILGRGNILPAPSPRPVLEKIQGVR